MRRIYALALVLSLAFPVVASAAGEIGDPDGLTASGDLAAPAPVAAWLGSVVRFLIAYAGL